MVYNIYTCRTKFGEFKLIKYIISVDIMETKQSQTNETTTLSHYREATDKHGQIIYVPVVDVRDGMAERALAEQIIKAANRSRYITYNRYHVSPKKQPL